jgi:general secretion pathway protein A
VTRRLIAQAAQEVFGDPVGRPERSRRRRAWGLGLAATAAVAGAAVVWVVPLREGVAPRLAWLGQGSASAPSSASAPVAAGPTAAQSGRSGTAASGSTAAAPTAFDIAALTASLPQDGQAAWRLLAPAWGLPADAAEPCADWVSQRIACFRGNTNLAQVRQLDRPGLLTLADARGRNVYALLTGLGPDHAELRTGDGTATVPLTALAEVWTGEFSTLWRWPQGREGKPAADESGTPPAWLAARLDDAKVGPGDLRTRLQTFQRAQGLRADGVAGPLTFMQLNRANGVAEPHLARGK